MSMSSSSPTSPGTPNAREGRNQHVPSQPSHLRQTYMPSPSPEDRRIAPQLEQDGIHPQDHAPDASTNLDSDATRQEGNIEEPRESPNAATALLNKYNHEEHGTWSPRPRHSRGYGSFASSYAETAGSFEQHRPSLGGRYPTTDDMNRQSNAGLMHSLPDSVTDGLLGKPKKRGTTHWLASRAGIKRERLMCVRHAPRPRLHLPLPATVAVSCLSLSLIISFPGTCTITFP